MTNIFGADINDIALGVGIAVAVVMAVLVFFTLRRPLVVKMGLRNIPRRRAQTVLIVFGLTLATIIVAMSFVTGDTLAISVREAALDNQRRIDHAISVADDAETAPGANRLISDQVIDDLRRQFDGDPRVDGVFGIRFVPASVRNLDTRLSEPTFWLIGVDPSDVDRVGAVPDERGGDFAMSGVGANEIVINETTAQQIAAEVGHTLELRIGPRAYELRVAAVAQDSLITGQVDDSDSSTGGVAQIETLRDALRGVDAVEGWTLVAVASGGSIRGGLDLSDDLDGVLEEYLTHRTQEEQQQRTAGRLGEADQSIYYDPLNLTERLQTNPSKKNAVDGAELLGAVLVLLFLFMGSFSVAAGVLLIFLIFAMLAEERRSEMGMSRAIGMQRDHLIQMFMSEGMVYNLGASVVGVALGLVITLGMVSFLNSALDAFGFTFTWSVTWQALVISGGIGLVITFITMTVSSFRASVLNIVAAIRDLPDTSLSRRKKLSLVGIVTTPLGVGLLPTTLITFPAGSVLLLLLGRTGNRRPPTTSWWLMPAWRLMLWRAEWGMYTTPIGLALLPTLPLTLLLGALALVFIGMLGGLRASAVPWLLVPAWKILTWRPEWWVPLFAGGVGLILYGLDRETLFYYSIGGSIAPLGLVMLLTRVGLPGRPLWTLASAFVLFFWLSPRAWHNDLFNIDLDGGPELFVVSGMMMTAAGALLLVFNLETLVRIFSVGMARAGKYAPVLRAAAAYPAASRYRTGMTIAMIALIMFALVNFTVVNSSFNRSTGTDDQLAGYAIQAESTRLEAIDDLRAALSEAGASDTLGRIRSSGALTAGPLTGTPVQTLRSERWDPSLNAAILGAGGAPIVDDLSGDEENHAGEVVLLAGDDGFYDGNEIALQARTADYDSDAKVWEELKRGEPVAIISRATVEGGAFAAGDNWRMPSDVDQRASALPRTMLRIGHSAGAKVEVEVIALTPTLAFDAFGPPGEAVARPSVIVPRAVWDQLIGEASLVRHLVAVRGGEDSLEVAQEIESTLLIEANDLAGEQERNARLTNSFLRAFQAFIGIGLAAGLAALGVIAVRAVVERRGQIGVLRSLGFRSRMVGLEMLLEMGFIAFLGVALGTTLALALAWRLFDEQTFGPGISLYIPVGTIAIFVVGALAASLVLTYLPARQAARTTIAEALRYE